MRRLRVVLLTTAVVLALGSPAAAQERIMPLAEVHKGMRCTGLSVVQGTEISSFDVEVLDVIAGDQAAEAPRILIQVSGPAVDRTGLGPGFSGSPVVCRDSEGRDAYAGAISEGVGEYGGRVGLATPMEAVVGQPVDPPAGAQPAPRTMRRARPLASPLTISGVSPRIARTLSRAMARGGRTLLTTAGRPRAHFPVQPLRPGAAMSASLSSGAVNVGGVGTVSYVDGDRVWAFGHPFDGAGRRSLFLQDAYVYTVVNNPVGVEGVSTYKLAAPGHDVGIVSGDGLQAIAGRLGVLPDRYGMRVIANDGDTGRVRDLRVEVADENALGQPTGVSALALVGSALTGQAATSVLGEIPARQSGEMCAYFHLHGEERPLRFCNRYVMRDGGITAEGGLGNGGAMVSDFLEAVSLIDNYEFGVLDMRAVELNLTLRRGLRQAYMIKASGPKVVRRGGVARVRVQIQAVRGAVSSRTIEVKVPRRMPRGPRILTLAGPGTDEAGVFEIDLTEALFGDEEEDLFGPRTVDKLRQAVARIGRYDGVEASFEPPGGEDEEDLGEDAPDGGERAAQRPRRVYRDPDLRLSGVVRLRVRVR
ncbi:MAG TPA: hypothetical protein VHF89_06245 [Solirubrobacteraceae bacterium]|nr:hypothetical protein [Solirubrobacteraceae bacterium]